MLAQLKTEHDSLRDLAGRLRGYLHGDRPPHDPAFAQLRWMLVRELSIHLATERRAVDVWCAMGGDGDGFDEALDDAFTRHIVAWSGATMASTWSRYCDETRVLLARLCDRMDYEERAVFPVLRGTRIGGAR